MMSKRILIINRGEIAIRVAKAINELGFISVGVWTDNEPAPMHLQYCKEWVHLAGANNKETYLAVDKIVEIIKKYKIAAVHPGYGFLSENSKFVKRLKSLE
jgi:acetyl/propionyl-CoA carboxylase alpha subunit